MTEELIRLWVRSATDEMRESAASPAVQPADEIYRDMDARLERLHKVADQLYDKWTEHLARG
jgi:hypothetical protein